MIFHIAAYASLLSWLACTVAAQQNITVDDNNSAIIYAPAGAWAVSANSTLDFGGTHMLTQNPNATATFRFTGTAIYFLSPKWPYTVNTAVSLDGGAPLLIDLVDHTRPDAGLGPETVQSAAVWGASGLADTQHTLVISVGAGQPFGVVDALQYTPSPPSTTSSTSTSPASSTTTTGTLPSTAPPVAQADTGKSKRLHVVPIVVGALVALIGLFVVGLALAFACRRRAAHGGEHDAWGAADGAGYPMAKTPGAWRNTRYGHIGTPPPSVGAGTGARAPHRYAPGAPLSTITEKSTPRAGEGRASLPHSPASALSAELPSGYYTAPGSEADGAGIVATLDAARREAAGLPEYVVQAPHPQPGWI